MAHLTVVLHSKKVLLYCNDSEIIAQSLKGIEFIETQTDEDKVEITVKTKLKNNELIWSIHDRYQGKNISGRSIGDLGYNLSDCLVFHFADKIKDAFCIHAGAVSLDDKAFLIVGESGAGKSTFTTWLVSQGAHYLTDELTVITTKSQVLGIPRPIQIKQHGIEAVSTLIKNKERLIIGSSVTGVPISALPKQNKNNSSLDTKLAGIIFVNYSNNTDYQLVKLSPADSGMKIMQNFVNARNLQGFGFSQLMSLIQDIPAYDLHYSKFEDCQGLIESL